MTSTRKRFWILSLALLGFVSLPLQAWSGDPVSGGGPFGIGIEAGYPGDWGIVGKLWLNYTEALQPDVKFTSDQAILQLDYLWHNYNLLRVHSGAFPFYIGVGGDIALTDPAVFGARLPIGLSYIFGYDTPLDIYAQIVPTVWFLTRSSDFDLYGNVGIRVYP